MNKNYSKMLFLSVILLLYNTNDYKLDDDVIS